jgi:antitoxin component of MazEF toxin-antitoxin module
MSRETQTAVTVSEPTPEVVAQLLDVVADHSVEVALSDMEQMIARLRADAEEAAEAREVLRNTPAEVLREALRLRAARIETVR